MWLSLTVTVLAYGGMFGAFTCIAYTLTRGIAAGLGYTSPIWIGAAITAVALVVMMVAATGARRSERESLAAAGLASTAASGS